MSLNVGVRQQFQKLHRSNRKLPLSERDFRTIV
jgi:hypothetical protein